MPEYIERETFLKDIEDRYCLPCKDAGRDHNGCKCRACWVDDMCGDVIDAPTADVAPVRHGKWSRFYKSGAEVEEGFVSSCCDMWNERRSHYCPNCGAYMRHPAEGK